MRRYREYILTYLSVYHLKSFVLFSDINNWQQVLPGIQYASYTWCHQCMLLKISETKITTRQGEKKKEVLKFWGMDLYRYITFQTNGLSRCITVLGWHPKLNWSYMEPIDRPYLAVWDTRNMRSDGKFDQSLQKRTFQSVIHLTCHYLTHGSWGSRNKMATALLFPGMGWDNDSYLRHGRSRGHSLLACWLWLVLVSGMS